MQYSYIKKEVETRDYDDIALHWNKDVNVPFPVLDLPDVLNFRSIFTGITERQKYFIIILIGLVSFSYLLGRREAYSKTVYEVSVERKNFILLRKYGDDLIFKNYDPKTKKLGNNLVLFKIGSSDANTFTTRHVGPLSYFYNIRRE